MWCKLRILFMIFASFVFSKTQCQTPSLSSTVNIPSNSNLQTKKDYLDYLSTKYGWTFSYNASQLNVDGAIRLPNQISSIQSVLEQIFPENDLQITFQQPKKIILQTKGLKQKTYFLSGNITDKVSGESIFGAIIIDNNSGKQVLSNEKGYYIMELPKGNVDLEIDYIAYKKTKQIITIDRDLKLNFELENDNLLDTIRIQNPKSRVQLIDGGHFIDVFKSQECNAIIGEKDIITNTRILPGVQSGGEGMSGIFVRGGTPDQNLILMEGVALYETSHLAGISSIFMDECIKEGSFIRNGFPARYGGRLSSVLDVQLKEGSKVSHNVSMTAGLPGAKLNLNGPIMGGKLTYLLSARTSWVNFYVNNLLKKYTKYDDIAISYHDILGKITKHFSPSNSISLTFYNGSDRLSLSKFSSLDDENDFQLNIYDKNGVNWGNTVASLRWNLLASDKVSLKFQTGIINYKNGTRSSYKFESIHPDKTKIDELDVITRSNITDINFRGDADFYFNDQHVIRTGFNFMNQNFNPTVKQSAIILEGDAENIVEKDSLIKANTAQFYIEDNYRVLPSVMAYGGFHFATYIQASQTYNSLQPRLKVIWSPHKNHMVTAAYSQMTQFLHLLSNTGLGLPSDLWVPSTRLIAPQHSTQWSANYTFNIAESTYINLGGFSKKFSNSLEYTTPIEMFYFLINNQNIVPVYNTARDWERNVIKGRTTSKGFEFLLHKPTGKLKGWISLTWSKTLKYFSEVNNGQAFPANHDKTWNMNVGLTYHFTPKFTTGANFVYNTGNTFSLATEEYNSTEGIKLLRSNGRNNYRLPAFHQLSINAAYLVKKEKYDIRYSLNVYNIYNRLNAYYIYIYENNSPPFEKILKKVSILPLTPTFNISINF